MKNLSFSLHPSVAVRSWIVPSSGCSSTAVSPSPVCCRGSASSLPNGCCCLASARTLRPFWAPWGWTLGGVTRGLPGQLAILPLYSECPEDEKKNHHSPMRKKLCHLIYYGWCKDKKYLFCEMTQVLSQIFWTLQSPHYIADNNCTKIPDCALKYLE